MPSETKTLAKRQIVQICQQMLAANLVIGSSGNASIRIQDTDTIAITPSRVDYTVMELKDVMIINLKGEVVEGDRNPSSEYPMHLGIYKEREEVKAVLHTHSIYASVLAVLGLPLPPVLDEFVKDLGGQIEVAKFALSGSKELAANVLEALGPRDAVLLANHGALSCGSSLYEAFDKAVLLERAAQIYVLAISANKGEPSLISEEALVSQKAMFEMDKRFKRRR
ncbi:MAG: class II aldolase/adducin family protein [Promethearchaeota archaeon]